MSTEFGLLVYDTENIGDEIQSVAASRFLPSVDYYINRDNIDNTKISHGNTCKVIMNSWYMAKPENWPPQNKQILPLLISMYIERDNECNRTDLAFTSPEGKKYAKKYGPIGGRDKGTVEFLQKHGIDSYFSGCLTLTLIPDERVKKKDFALAVDVSEKALQKIKSSTTRQVITINTERHTSISYDDKMKIARYWLFLYQSAHCVITGRLHAILPCLAFDTPVFAIEKKDMRRYGGLIELTNHCSEDSFIKRDINLDNPPKNPNKYKKIQRKLVKTCTDFTGCDSKNSYMSEYDSPQDLFEDVSPVLCRLAELSYKEEFRCHVLQRENDNLYREIESLRMILQQKEDIGLKGHLIMTKDAFKKYIKRKFRA